MNRKSVKRDLPLIQAYAEGAEIQYQSGNGKWCTTAEPAFSADLTYRVKPKTPKSIPLRRYMYAGISDEQCYIGTVYKDTVSDDYFKRVEGSTSFRGWLDKDWTTFSLPENS